jgi:hypothetical protein
MVLRLEHRQHPDRYLRIANAYPPDRLDSGHTGHLPVDQDQVGLQVGRRRHGLIAARCLANHMEPPIFFQDFGNALTEKRVVIDEQHADGHGLTNLTK